MVDEEKKSILRVLEPEDKETKETDDDKKDDDKKNDVKKDDGVKEDGDFKGKFSCTYKKIV